MYTFILYFQPVTSLSFSPITTYTLFIILIITHLSKGAGHVGERALVNQEEESLCWVQLEAAAAEAQEEVLG